MATFYYVSETPISLLLPTVVKPACPKADIPRICLSRSLQGSLARLNESKKILDKTLHVYIVESDKYYTPVLSDAPLRDITEEVWLQEAVEPHLVCDIQVTGIESTKAEEVKGHMTMVPVWKYEVLRETINEDTRVMLVNKSRSAGPYKDQSRGKNRFERKKYSQVAKTVKQYNKIDMNQLFKQDILLVHIPVTGETDNYTVSIKIEGVVAEIAKNIKNNKNQLEHRTVMQALAKVFNSGNVYVKCTCPDHTYRYAHWNIIDNVSVDDSAQDPGPGKGIANPNDKLGRGCKHILLVLANGDWLMKVASVINNYIHYAEKHLQKPFLKLIFPKLYGVPFDEAEENNLLPVDFELKSTSDIIDTINDYGKNRGKYQKGSNKNPVTGTGGKAKKPVEEPKEEPDKDTDEGEAEES